MTDGRGGVQDLALQIAQVDPIVIDQVQCPDAGCGQIHGRRRTQSAETDDQCACALQALLAFDPQLGEHDLAAVTQQCIVVHLQGAGGVGHAVVRSLVCVLTGIGRRGSPGAEGPLRSWA